MDGQLKYGEFATHFGAFDGVNAESDDIDGIILGLVVDQEVSDLARRIDSLITDQLALGKSREAAIQLAVHEIGPPDLLQSALSAAYSKRLEPYREGFAKRRRAWDIFLASLTVLILVILFIAYRSTSISAIFVGGYCSAIALLLMSSAAPRGPKPWVGGGSIFPRSYAECRLQDLLDKTDPR